MSDNEHLRVLKERGLRLKLLREMLNEKRQSFAKKLGITRVTLSYWENATTLKSGLHEDGARKIADFAQKAGIIFELPWLLYGVGPAPKSIDDSPLIFENQAKLDKQKEIGLFLSFSDAAVIVSITNNAMSPIFEVGDIVGGLWQPVDNLQSFDSTYIVEIEKSLYVRKIRTLAKKNTYDIHAMAYTNDINTPFEIKNIVLTRVAPVIRLWR